MFDEFNNANFTVEQVNQVYTVLVNHAGAREDGRNQFVAEFTKESPTSEYRFKGSLGMGGKFRFPRMSVDCYPEDNNPSRQAWIDGCNEALTLLRNAFNTST